jgi:uncharacterized protein
MSEKIPGLIRTEILKRMHAAELEHNVKILLSVESGSRAWGFESPNSDFDVRFIYAHKPDWYLSVSLEEQRDVIEYPITDEIDINGWDIRKALRLFWKSNPAFVEWIQSPIIYAEHGTFAQQVRQLLPQVYSCLSGIHHYRSMAKTNFRGYLRDDLVPIKKYFYVLRPLLAVRWLEKYQTAAPIEFQKMLHLIDENPQLLRDIDVLLERKRGVKEMGLEPRFPRVDAFIESELLRLESVEASATPRGNVISDLNELFRSTLTEVWDAT